MLQAGQKREWRPKKISGCLRPLKRCGKIYLHKEGVHFRVTKYSDLSDKIIPFFQKYSIIGIKALDFKDFCIAADMMKNKKDYV